MKKQFVKAVAAGFALLALAAGCKRDEVQVYQIQEQAPPPQMPQAPEPAMTNAALPPGHPDISGMAVPAMNENSTAPLTWKTPDGWTEIPLTEFRVASFKIESSGKTADVSIVPLPGLAGGDAANVNRWRGQVGLPAATDDALQKSAENVEAGGQPAQLYDVVGTNPASGDKTRIIAVIQHRADATWFYKMTGDADLAEAQKPAFVEFLKSLKFSDASAQTGMPNGGSSASLPPGHPQISDLH